MKSIKNNRNRFKRFKIQGGSNRNPSKQHSKKSVTLNPDRLVKKATITEQVAFLPAWTFDQIKIAQRLKANLRNKGYKYPTQIQQETLEPLCNGRDLIGIANTGTGKTGAFLLPIVDRLLKDSSRKALIVVPTRELALQVECEFKSMVQGLNLYSATFIGGTNVGKDLLRLKTNNQVIVGTPGRLNDLIHRGALRLDETSVLVLDEFDRMLDMGFIRDIKKIVKSMTGRQQTMLFSATIDNTQKSYINTILTDPVEIRVNKGDSSSDNVDQDIIIVPKTEDKFQMLLSLLYKEEVGKALIFAETKRMVNKISKRLNQSGVPAEQIHGNKTQNYRIKALDKFKTGSVQVLVATDVAARGIDVSDISHVINYQLPLSFESYIHRIGRTGRAGKTGNAFTFVDAA